MDTTLAGRLEQIVSAPRLQRYRDAATSDLEAVTLYCWNIRLAEALMPSLAMLEVALRNAVHNTLTTDIGNEFWFKSVLQKRMYDNLIDLIARITNRQGQPPTAGKIVSETTFGFWQKIFAKSYNSLWWSQSNPLIATVIPHHPNIARDTRAQFEQRLEYFVALRNRVMHQEAVFQGVAALNRPILPINTLHTQLFETIGWINSDATLLASCLDRFDGTYRYGKADVETHLRERFDL